MPWGGRADCPPPQLRCQTLLWMPWNLDSGRPVAASAAEPDPLTQPVPAAPHRTAPIASLPAPQFFLAPSLTTGRGDVSHASGFSTREARQLLGGAPEIEVALRCETASTLLLRGVLQRDNPAHRAILQSFPGGWVRRVGAAGGPLYHVWLYGEAQGPRAAVSPCCPSHDQKKDLAT